MNPKDLYTLKFEPQGVFLTLTEQCFEDPSDKHDLIASDVKARSLENLNLEHLRSALDKKFIKPMQVAPAQLEPVDGRVTAMLSDDGSQVLIKIDHPMGKGRKNDLKDVLAATKTVGAGEFFLDTQKIEDMLRSVKFREFEVVGERRDSTFQIEVSKDATEVYLTLVPPCGGKQIQDVDVFRQLNESRIVHGIKAEVIQDTIRDDRFNERILIAEGDKAEDGKDGTIEFYFDINAGKPRPQISEDGEVNFRELNMFSQCKAGEPLARRIPGEPGKPGKTIFGTVLGQRVGKDIILPIGANTKASPDDPNLILASIAGQPKFMNKKVNVISLLEINGDVDYSTGNINFSGTVHIRGNVMSGFTVKAIGDVQIGGCVECATIECGGNLSIAHGIVGMEKALVVCKAGITTKFIDKATVYADGDIYVDESIMFSSVNSQSHIVLSGKKGFIMGGVTRASNSVTCNQVGTTTETPTFIEIGGSPTLRLELEKLEKEIRDSEQVQENQTRSLETVAKKRAQQENELTTDQKQRVSVMARERFMLLSKLRTFREKKEDLEDRLGRISSAGVQLNVKGRVLSGTKITVKNASIFIHDSIDFTTFYENDGEVKFMPFEPPKLKK